MPGRNYERMSIEEFGKHLLDTNELDPVYVALWRLMKVEGGWSLAQVQRWLVAYWCFYNCGVASWMSEHEGGDFWEQMLLAAENEKPNPVGERWPRGHERRHFRGAAAVQAVTKLRERHGEPEKMVQYVVGEPDTAHHRTFEAVSGRVKEHHLFGPWIAFKVADMVDRVLGVPVDFSEAAVFMFKDPVKSALMLFRQKAGLSEGAKIKDEKAAIHQVVEYLIDHFKDYKAPPAYDRPVGLQEVETILCCWKSHMNGHYPLYNDIDDITQGTAPWADVCGAAGKFLEHMPRREHVEQAN